MAYEDNAKAGWMSVNGTVTASSISVNKYAKNPYTERCANYSFFLDKTSYIGSSCSGNISDADSFYSGKTVELLVNPTNPEPVLGMPSRSWWVSGSMIKEDYTPFGWFKLPFLGGGVFWMLFGLFFFIRELRK